MGLDYCLHHSCVSIWVELLALMTTELTSFRIIGGALMSFLDKGNKSGILAGIYLVNAVVAPLTIFYSVSNFELCVFDHWTNF